MLQFEQNIIFIRKFMPFNTRLFKWPFIIKNLDVLKFETKKFNKELLKY